MSDRYAWLKTNNWDEEDQEEFLRRLGRMRTQQNRAYALMTKAWYLTRADSAQKRAAGEDMLLRVAQDASNDGFDLAHAHRYLAEFYEADGRIDEAVRHLETALDLAENTGPPVAVWDFGLRLAVFAVRHDVRRLYATLEQLLPRHVRMYVFADPRFSFLSSMAIISASFGRTEDACLYARKAMAIFSVRGGTKFSTGVFTARDLAPRLETLC